MVSHCRAARAEEKQTELVQAQQTLQSAIEIEARVTEVFAELMSSENPHSNDTNVA